MGIVLFTYDRPHWKTERFILELVAHGHRPMVVGAPWRTLNLPPAAVVSVRHDPRHPRALCLALGLDYQVLPHTDPAITGKLGIVAGARILGRDIIDRFSVGILNTHPGLIPENRGLSNLCRAMRDGLPQAVTAHLIDERVDAGRVLMQKIVPRLDDDMVQDLAERIMDTQVQVLMPAVAMALDGVAGDLLPDDLGGYEPPLTADKEWAIIEEHFQL